MDKDLLIKAMEAAGYYYDDIDSYSDGSWLVFSGEEHTAYFGEDTGDGWQEVEDWLDGVVFDDPERSDAVEKILHPDHFVKASKSIKASRKYDFGGDNMSVFSDEFFTKEEVNEFCYALEDDLSSAFDLSVVTYDSYIDNTVNFHIAMDVDGGYIIETDFTVDFRRIQKPDDLYKYYQQVYDDLAEQIEEYERF